jgi:transposase
MWAAYSSLAGSLFPNAISVIDRYHFFIHLNKALDLTRKSVRKLFPDEPSFKYLRWALLKNPDHLSDAEKKLLSDAFRNSSELQKIYEMRVDLKVIFDTDLTKKEAFIEVGLWEKRLVVLAINSWIRF